MFLLLHHCEAAEPDDKAVDVDEAEPEPEAAAVDEDEDEENEAILAVVVVVVAVATRELAEPIARRSSCCVVDIDACKLGRIWE